MTVATPAGLDMGMPRQLWRQGANGIGGQAETGDQFGFALATADFNSDGMSDLVVGVPLEDQSTIVDAGVVYVLYGTVVALTAVGGQTWFQGSVGLAAPDFSSAPERLEARDLFGSPSRAAASWRWL